MNSEDIRLKAWAFLKWLFNLPIIGKLVEWMALAGNWIAEKLTDLMGNK